MSQRDDAGGRGARWIALLAICAVTIPFSPCPDAAVAEAPAAAPVAASHEAVVAEAGTAAITIELWAQAVKGGIAVHWQLRDTSPVEELSLYRREARGPEQLLIGWTAPTSLSGDWTDTAVHANVDYAYRLVADIGGSEASSGAAVVRMDPSLLPRLGLEGASPNPFNPSTRIAFRLARAEVVHLRIYDGAGRCVRHLDLGTRGAGEGFAPWNGCDGQGRRVASGVYVVQMLTPSQKDQLLVAVVK